MDPLKTGKLREKIQDLCRLRWGVPLGNQVVGDGKQLFRVFQLVNDK